MFGDIFDLGDGTFVTVFAGIPVFYIALLRGRSKCMAEIFPSEFLPPKSVPSRAGQLNSMQRYGQFVKHVQAKVKRKSTDRAEQASHRLDVILHH